MSKRYVAYYRVSTKRQGKSGLGLEAQEERVRLLTARNGATIIAVYTEVETGKKAARPKLLEAIRHARLTNSTLVVAKLDRLARNSYFMGCLQQSRLPFICCDNEHATPFTIQILAAVAEHEARQISERTSAALQAAKAKGTLLGSARPGHWANREDKRTPGQERGLPVAQKQNATLAREFYGDVLMPEIKRRREAGESISAITDWLNSQGFTTRKGNAYTVTQVWRLIERYLGQDYLGQVGSIIRPVRAMVTA